METEQDSDGCSDAPSADTSSTARGILIRDPETKKTWWVTLEQLREAGMMSRIGREVLAASPSTPSSSASAKRRGWATLSIGIVLGACAATFALGVTVGFALGRLQ